ncbi:MAG: hypothetical protein M3281_07120, partial [Chloroflexota bacterium]|nr:hypothetical protein [Chloroflexota bacterium]
VGVACAPLALYTLVNLPLSALQGALGSGSAVAGVLGLFTALLGLAALVWHIALVILGERFAMNLTTGESSGACGLSCVGCAAIIAVIALLTILLAASLAAGASTAS